MAKAAVVAEDGEELETTINIACDRECVNRDVSSRNVLQPLGPAFGAVCQMCHQP
jgi:hypothetical protein